MNRNSDIYSNRMNKLGAEPLRSELARLTGTQPADWYLVFKARQGMKAVFDALAAHEVAHDGRGEVVTQLFTCCTAVDPIVAAGLTPVYGDISADTLALDPAALPLSENTAALVLQHTFGVFDAVADETVVGAARRSGILVVEDNAHAVARLAMGADGKPLADISAHSFGVEKMLPTHFGGAIWVNPAMTDTALRERIVAELTGLSDLDAAREAAARNYLNQIRLIMHLPGSLGHKLRVHLERSGKFEPAVGDIELAGGLNGEPALPSNWVVNRALGALQTLDEGREARSQIVELYRSELTDFEAPFSPDNAALLKYCVLVDDAASANDATEALNAAGIYTVPWYRPLLFPGVTAPEAYGATSTDALPHTQRCSDCAVCLPTDISPERAAVAIEIVKNITVK